MQSGFTKTIMFATGSVKSVKLPSVREPTVPRAPLPYYGDLTEGRGSQGEP
jgi:hypothetical protein